MFMLRFKLRSVIHWFLLFFKH